MARIMVVEDDTHISRVICLWLKRNGHEAMSAVDGRTALEMIRANPPDMLLTDVNLPIMDGIQLLQSVRDEKLIDSPAIVLTSRCDQAEISAKASALGAVVHPKPFSPFHLVEAIEKALGKRSGPPEPVTAGDTSGV